MDIESIREYCLGRPFAAEAFPFDEDTMVFKVGWMERCRGKIFLLTSLSAPEYILVKCEPERAIELRERYPDQIEGGFHMNKKYWNGIYLDRGRLTDGQIRGMIDRSYELVVKSLPKWVRDRMAEGIVGRF